MTATETVHSFVEAWNDYDLERILGHLDRQVVYHNMPAAPLVGLEAVRAYLESKGGFERMHWELLAVAASGDKVLTERVDRFTWRGIDVTLPIMGIFEIEGGLIRAWRDYFDMATYQRQLEAGRKA